MIWSNASLNEDDPPTVVYIWILLHRDDGEMGNFAVALHCIAFVETLVLVLVLLACGGLSILVQIRAFPPLRWTFCAPGYRVTCRGEDQGG